MIIKPVQQRTPILKNLITKTGLLEMLYYRWCYQSRHYCSKWYWTGLLTHF